MCTFVKTSFEDMQGEEKLMMSSAELLGGNQSESSSKETSCDDLAAYSMGLGKCRPAWLQRFNSIQWFTAILCICSLTQGIVIYGLVAVSIESIEKEFGISSKVSGFILVGQHASTLLVVTYVSFFGGKGNKPKWIGIGSLISGIGAIVFVAPKLVAGSYEPPEYKSITGYDICASNKTVGDTWQCEDKFSSEKIFNVILFFVGEFIMGAGATPYYTLGPAYLDENVAPEVSPIYLGIWMTFAMMGPALGFTVGGAFLKVYTDIDVPQHLNMNSTDRRWVGAWWIGFVIMSVIFMITGTIILLYPKELKGGRLKRKEQICKGHLPGSDEGVVYTFKGYLKECLKICSNLVFMLMVLGTTVQHIYGAGLFGFVIKVLILKFGVDSTKASVVIGVALILAILCGIMGGSYIMKKVKVEMAGKSGAKYCAIISFIVMASSFMWMVPGCKNTNLAGVMTPYYNSSQTSSLTTNCNSHCKCSEAIYLPICGSDKLTYHSPCFAGCVMVTETADGVIFSNCSCIKASASKITPTPIAESTTVRIPGSHGARINVSTVNQDLITPFYRHAKTTKCDRDCKNFYIFILLVILVSIIGSLAGIPHKIVILRCVADNKRSFALGMQTLIMRLFALPGPLLVGAIVDTDCITWAFDNCGRKKNCLDYDINMMSKKLVMLGCLTAAIGTLLFALGWFFYPDTKSSEQIEPSEAEAVL